MKVKVKSLSALGYPKYSVNEKAEIISHFTDRKLKPFGFSDNFKRGRVLLCNSYGKRFFPIEQLEAFFYADAFMAFGQPAEYFDKGTCGVCCDPINEVSAKTFFGKIKNFFSKNF